MQVLFGNKKRKVVFCYKLLIGIQKGRNIGIRQVYYRFRERDGRMLEVNVYNWEGFLTISVENKRFNYGYRIIMINYVWRKKLF